jgi:hypothetical protein
MAGALQRSVDQVQKLRKAISPCRAGKRSSARWLSTRDSVGSLPVSCIPASYHRAIYPEIPSQDSVFGTVRAILEYLRIEPI